MQADRTPRQQTGDSSQRGVAYMVVLLGLLSVLVVGAQADQQQAIEEALDDQPAKQALPPHHHLTMGQPAHA